MREIEKESPEVRYALRFGEIAIDMGFLTPKQLQEALSEQHSNDPAARLRPRKLIGEILFEQGWMTINQIDLVLKEIFKDQR